MEPQTSTGVRSGDETQVGPPRPTLRTAAPFVTVATLGVTIAMMPPYSTTSDEPWLMLVGFAATLGILAVSLRRPVRTWLDPVAPWLFFVVVVLARDLTGGSGSGLAPMVALPIFWLALTGTRREMGVAAGLTLAVFVGPLLVVGAPAYVGGDWRLGVLWTAVAVFVAPAVQRLVKQLARESAKVREINAEVVGIMRGASMSSIIASDTTGTVSSFSRGAEELLGYRAADVVGVIRREVLHDADEMAAVALELGVEPGCAVFAELARRGAPARVWTQVRADGRRSFVRLALTELRDHDGTLTGCLGVAIDSTAAVEAERALARSEATWRVLLQHLPDMTVVMVDHTLRMLAVGGAGAARQGLEGGEGRPMSEFSGPANMAIFTPLLDDAFEGREGSVELNASRTGAEHEATITPLPSGDDGPRALILARDVSRDRAREREVLRAKERAERLFADAPYGVVLLTRGGAVLEVNDAMRVLVGPFPDDLRGHPFATLARPGDDTLHRHLSDAEADPGARVETDWTLRTADGTDVHVLLSSRLLLGDTDLDDFVLVNVVDVSERRRYEQRLAHLADHDVLTGLANRRRFDEELHEHLEHCRRYGPAGALLMIDLDHFKDVNDTLGHAAGDQLIISTAALLRSRARSTDVVARLGGDEFAVLLVDSDREGAEAVARSIVELVREHTATLDGTRRRVTASVGVVTFRAAGEHEVDILALADMTMYDAKEAGRDCFVVLDEGSQRQPRTGARLAWERRIEDALENDAFVLLLQPILDLRTDTIHSAEVLLRLADSDELVPPARFLYIAERAGLMPAVDAWVVEHGVEMLASLRQLAPDFELEVNLSGQSIGNTDIERVIVSSLQAHGVDPRALILEITETSAVADVEVARAFAERMTSLGCKFALDDFGAGFGSFYYLKHLLFDYVKIDGEFVATSHRSGIDRTILRSIVGIARDLGKQTIAEFVAEPAVLEVVRAEGVDLAQGYGIGRPVPYDEFVTRHLSGGVSGQPALPRPKAPVSTTPRAGLPPRARTA